VVRASPLTTGGRSALPADVVLRGEIYAQPGHSAPRVNSWICAVTADIQAALATSAQGHKGAFGP
jgi:hypothetical protein